MLAEVFGVDRTDDGVPPFDYRVCGERPGRALAAGAGTKIVPADPLSATAEADLVAVVCSRPDEPPTARVPDAIRAAHERGAYLLALCSGVFALAYAGVLDGRRVATHWRYADRLAAVCPTARIDHDILYFDDDRLVSCAGTASGIDTCLHLVRSELGLTVANRIARRMVVQPPRGGDRAQVPRELLDAADGLRPVLDWLDDRLDQPLAVSDMARAAGTSERTLLRRFGQQLDVTPYEWLTRRRVARAAELLAHSTLSVDEVARQSGFDTAPLLRHHFRRVLGTSPTAHRRNST